MSVSDESDTSRATGRNGSCRSDNERLLRLRVLVCMRAPLNKEEEEEDEEGGDDLGRLGIVGFERAG